MKVESESEVAQSCPTLSDPMDCSPLGSSVHGIFQATVLEWGAIAFCAADTRNHIIEYFLCTEHILSTFTVSKNLGYCNEVKNGPLKDGSIS